MLKKDARSMRRLPDLPTIPDVLVLCGGLGTRLKSVTGEAPKALAEIAGRPFLELLLRQLERHGFRRVILAVGYQSDAIREHFGSSFGSLAILYSEERRPLGTAGAIRNAAHLFETESILIANGDSYTDADLVEFVTEYHTSDCDAMILLVPTDGRSDCGTVALDATGRVTQFEEKQSLDAPPLINAGIYLLSRERVEAIPADTQVSIEREIFPEWISNQVTIKSYVHRGSCLDIGTPERFQGAQDLLKDAEVH